MKIKIFIDKEELLEDLRDFLKVEDIAKKHNCSSEVVMLRLKEYGLKPLGSKFFNKGCNNPAKQKEVREKISKTVKGLWENNVYKDRINGMAFKFDWEHPNFKPYRHYREFVKKYQPLLCCYCGCSEKERKIDIHHLDENRNNWLLTNLIPVCNVCHQFFHFERYKTPFVRLIKDFEFESAHHLLNYIGACENTHGHSYKLQIVIEGMINRDTGMVIDYKDIKEKVKQYVINVLDHHYLNDLLDCNTTAENLLCWIWEQLEKKALLKGVCEIRLKETSSSEAIIRKEDMIKYYTLNKENICLGGD